MRSHAGAWERQTLPTRERGDEKVHVAPLRFPLVPTVLRGNPYYTHNFSLTSNAPMRSHAGAWERETLPTRERGNEKVHVTPLTLPLVPTVLRGNPYYTHHFSLTSNAPMRSHAGAWGRETPPTRKPWGRESSCRPLTLPLVPTVLCGNSYYTHHFTLISNKPPWPA